MRLFLSFVFLYLTAFLPPIGEEWFLQKKQMLISLGGDCSPADALRSCSLRFKTFPFDWIATFEQKSLIMLLKDDFAHFFDERYLTVKSDHVLCNTYYGIEFHHEGSWKKEFYNDNFEKLKDKYIRRIERFRLLKKYQGQVCFFRAFNGTALQANKLKQVLRNFFPNLNFNLIMISSQPERRLSYNRLSKRILMVYFPKNLEKEERVIHFYQPLFNYFTKPFSEKL